jgi:hypothetical protein
MMTSLRRLILPVVFVGSAVFALASPATAQVREPQSESAQLGAGDFRTAPVLGNGDYSDTAVPEETVWYAFRTSEPEQTVSATAAITDSQLANQLGLSLGFVGPDLAAVAESGGGSISQVLTFSQTNQDQSTTWYLTVRTSPGGSRLADAVIPFAITLDGADAADVEACTVADCPPAADATRLLADVEEAEALLDANALASQPVSTPMSDDERLQLHNRRRVLTAKVDAHNPTPASPQKGPVLGAALVSVFVGYFAATRIPRGRLRRPQLLRLHPKRTGEPA